ncbi:MAG TPA: CZB domain-containing protein, partial [Rhodocyclaceae bacterium]|nr:CZB domain-containing protein [Rhodocyclaceae bacterium]
WVAHVAAAVEAEDATVLPRNVANHHGCNFGRWYQREGFAHYSHMEEFRQIGPLHQKVHEDAARIADLLGESGGNPELAQALATLIRDRDAVMVALHRLQERVVAINRQ